MCAARRWAGQPPLHLSDSDYTALGGQEASAAGFGGPAGWRVPALRCPNAGPTQPTQGGQGARGVDMTLGQACPPGCRRAQCAFKDSMIH